MDESDLDRQLAGLSLSASEWKPGSEWKPKEVKEFVPGTSWKQDAAPATAEPTLTAAPEPPETVVPSFRNIQSVGVTDDLFRNYRFLNMEKLRQMDSGDPRHKAIPPPYCNAYCLDTSSRRSEYFGYPCTTFQVVNREDGKQYVLKRFDSVRSVSAKIARAVNERWAAIDHPNISRYHVCFLSQRAVFFVHEYIPGARALRQLSEPELWSSLVQLAGAISTVHGQNLAVRNLRLPYLLSWQSRVVLGSLGITDALEFEARKDVRDLQVQDMRDLGYLILSLATGRNIVNGSLDSNQMAMCENFLSQNYSMELHNLTMTLVRSSMPPSIGEVVRAIGPRILKENARSLRQNGVLEDALSSEYNSGRALRLLLKLGFINERPEFGQDRRWATSGDCYILALFRDYDGAGNPVMDLGHVITALNKLDAADDEKIVLTSRDGQVMMVVSYADISRCLESAFTELCNGSVPPSVLQY